MFSLVKWYGDCVTGEGVAFVGYWAELRWRELRIRYGSCLDNGEWRTTIRSGREPISKGGGYEWREPAINIDARWDSTVSEFTATIFAGESGRIEWECVAPAARARAQGREGWGYLERIEMTVAPWALPIDELFWGRYLADGESLVWMDWRGPYSKRLALRNGEPVDAVEIGREGLLLASGERLQFESRSTLRAGEIGSTVLSKLEALKSLVPVRLLRVGEQKWLSRGRLLLGEKVLNEGWAIHEVVTWPPR
jgi:hypothetical protein